MSEAPTQPFSPNSVCIPAGVTMYVEAEEEGESDTFGLARMMHAKIGFFAEDVRSDSDKIDGLRLRYKGGIRQLIVEVKQVELEAEKINRIGELCLTFSYLIFLDFMLSHITKGVTSAVNILAVYKRSAESIAHILAIFDINTALDIEPELDSYGAVVSKIRAASRRCCALQLSILQELNGLDVTCLSIDKSPYYNGWDAYPIGLYIENRKELLADSQYPLK